MSSNGAAPIVVVLLLVLPAVTMVAAPDRAPAVLAPLVVSAAWPWWAAWKATRGTALRPALVWAILAIVAAVVAQAVGWTEPIDGGRPGAGRLTYLSTLAALAALGSVLNARSPGGRVWAGLMAILVLVFLIPWLEGPWRVRRAGGLTLLHLDAPWTFFYVFLVVVGVTNHLPTRFGTAAVWLALGFLLEYLGLTRDDWPASRRASCWSWYAWALAAAAWAAHRAGWRAPQGCTRLERLWFWFRDLWGVVWALRILERFNRTAELKGWPIRLGWFGLERAPGAADGLGPPGAPRIPRIRGRLPESDPPVRPARAARRGRHDGPGLVLPSGGCGAIIASRAFMSWSWGGAQLVDRRPKDANRAQIVLAVLAVIAALSLLKTILIPIAIAVVLTCIFSPLARLVRSHLPYGPLGALALFLLMVLGGLYLASLTAEGLVRATYTLPADIERLAGQVSHRIADLIRDQPYLRAVLPEPGTIDRLGDTNRAS